MAITPEMARAELARRRSMAITPEMARAELARRRATSQPKPQAPSGGLLERAAESPITKGILNIGGGLSEGLLQGMNALGNLPAAAGLTSYRFPEAPKAPFVDPSSSLYAGAKTFGGMLPALGVAPEAAVAEGLPLAAEAGRMGLAALATTPGTAGERLESGAETALGGVAVPGAARGIAGAYKGGKKLTNALLKTNIGRAVKESTQNAINMGRDMFNDVPLNKTGNIINRIGDTVRKNYKIYSKQGSDMFNDSLGDYKNKKIIEGPVKEFKVLNEITSALGDKKGKATGALLRSVDKFKKAPTFSNMHKLQSKIGNKVNELRSVESAEQDYGKISKLEGVQNRLLDFIETSLPGERGAQYTAARKHWADHVVPYSKDNVLNKTVFKKENPKSLPGRLTAMEAEGAKRAPINTALGHMSPDEVEQILAVPLRKAFKTSGDVNANKLLASLDALGGTEYNKLLDVAGSREKIESYINTLSKDLENIEAQKELSKRVRGTAGNIGKWVGAGAGAALGFKKAGEYLGE